MSQTMQAQMKAPSAIKPVALATQSRLLQRKCACGGSPGVDGECTECRAKRLSMQRQAATNPAASSSAVPPIVHDVLSSPGQMLDAGTRAFMEPRFGHDFSNVRVHTDTKAVESARAVNALAYTVGRNVVFGTGQYSPGTGEGKRLMAHELTHVVQQSQNSVGSLTQIGPSADLYEREANATANTVDRGSSTQSRFIAPSVSTLQGSVSLQRLIRAANVHCPAAAAGVTSPNPFSADRRASMLLDMAITKVSAARAVRSFRPTDPDVVDVGKALHTAFHLNPVNEDTWTLGPPHVRLPVIQRRLEYAKSYIDSVTFTTHCFAAGGGPGGMPCGTCGPAWEAYTCPGDGTDIALCPPFWASNLNQRGRILAHEVFHINFGFIADWGSPCVHNAHCYAQFVALLNGFNSPPHFRCLPGLCH